MAKKRGRKIHNFYEDLHFSNKKLENGRTAAQCILCNTLLKNTGIERLIVHRKKCHPESLADVNLNQSSDVTTDSELTNDSSIPDKLLLQKKKGTKLNNSYESLQYINTKTDSGKTVAQCLICKTVLKNTAVGRLQIHRKRCHAHLSEDGDQSVSIACLPTVSEDVKRGRKLHNFYEDLQFITIKMDNGRTGAQCILCNIVLKNTGIDRLKIHRKRCKESIAKSSADWPTSDSDVNIINKQIKGKRKTRSTTKQRANIRKRRLIDSPTESSSEEEDSEHSEQDNDEKIKPEEIWIQESNEDSINKEIEKKCTEKSESANTLPQPSNTSDLEVNIESEDISIVEKNQMLELQPNILNPLEFSTDADNINLNI